jgi:hypothetical protein
VLLVFGKNGMCTKLGGEIRKVSPCNV